MADIKLVYKHNTNLDDAKKGVKDLVDDFVQSQGSLIKETKWSNNETRCEFKGKGFSGSFEVDEEKIYFELDLSFLLKGLKGKITQQIEKKVKDRFPNGEFA